MSLKRFFPLAAALGAAALFFAYANSLRNAFSWDDQHVIVNNVYIRSLSNVPRFFRDAYTFSSIPKHATWRPLVTLTYAIDYRLGHGLEPLQFHVTQIVLLVVIWAMLIAFLHKALDVAQSDLHIKSVQSLNRRLKGWKAERKTKALPLALSALQPSSLLPQPAFPTLCAKPVQPSPHNRWMALIAATVWAIHTVNTETLNLISARSEELAAIGTLAAFLLIQFSERARRWHLYLVPIAIGAMAKAQIVIFGVLLLVYLVLIEQRSLRKQATWLAVLPSLLGGAALLVLLDRLNAPEFVPGGTSKWHYFLAQGRACAHYTRLFFLPLGLTVDSDMKPLEQWYDLHALLGFAFVALLLLVIRDTSRRNELLPVAFGLSWFAVALLPTSSIYPLAEVVNEHRVFLPYMGLALAAVFALDLALRQHPRLFAAVSIAAILALGAGTVVRNRVWTTEESLWRDAVAKSPGNARALLNYGSIELTKGNYAVAKSNLDRAELLNPHYALLEVTLGILAGQLHDRAGAEVHFHRALALSPDDVDTHFYYADWLVRDGRAPAALPELQLAIRLGPARPEARALLMKLDAAAGDTTSLRALASKARSFDASNPDAAAVFAGGVPGTDPGTTYDACFNAGLDAIGSDRFLDAALANRKALRFNPNSPDAWINLGWSLAQLGLDPQSAQAFERALQLRPGDEHAKSNLEWVRRGKK